MLSFGYAKLLASTLVHGAIRPEGLATAGALLTCVAVVLNVGPFVAAQKNEPVRLVLAGVPMPQAERVAFVAPPEPEPVPAPAQGERPLFWLASADVAMVQPVAAQAADVPPEPSTEHAETAPADHAPAEAAPGIVGVWSPDGGTCSARDFKDGTLPTVINAEGAWAGETFCIFTKRKEIDSGWRVVAKCSTPRARWTSNVRLTVSDNRLTWTSERGTQAYKRCASDVLMAQAR